LPTAGDGWRFSVGQTARFFYFPFGRAVFFYRKASMPRVRVVQNEFFGLSRDSYRALSRFSSGA